MSLAIFRIAVGAVLLTLPETHSAPSFARLDPVLRHSASFIPQIPELVDIAYVLTLGAGILALIGLFSRAACLTLALAGVYLLGVPQSFGTVLHDHHLIWFALLLGVSPSGDALSIDSLLRRQRGLPAPSEESAAYGLPLRIAQVLVGLIFFFPGFWKLATSGLDWIFTDNVRNLMWAKWLQNDFTPVFRLDRFPLLCRLAALATVLFELLFIFAIFHRRTRGVALISALLFHLGTALFLDLHFPALWICYVVFVDWDRLLGRAGTPALDPESTSKERGRLLPIALAGVFLVGGASIYGARGKMDAWPFACYPTFQWVVGTSLPGIELEVVNADGTTLRVPSSVFIERLGRQRYWGLAGELAGTKTVSPGRIAGLWEAIRSHSSLEELAGSATRLRLSRTVVSTDPDASIRLLRRSPLGEIELSR